MPNFTQSKNHLNQSRQQISTAKDNILRLREKLAKAGREKDQLNRIYDPQNSLHVQQSASLSQDMASFTSSIEQWQTSLGEAKLDEGSFLNQFLQHSDPRSGIGQMKDQFPILLLPVRIETRFKNTGTAQQPRHELWIRIFPDDCAIDSFEHLFSEAELKNIKTYWVETWAAGGFEEQERSAWKALVASHGSGRARWMVEQFIPENASDIPSKTNASDVILIVAASTLPTGSEQAAVSDFWKLMWLADGDAAAENTAYLALVSALGATRAAEIKTDFKPGNFDFTPLLPLTKPDVGLSVAYLDFKPDSDFDTTLQSWTEAPKVNVMPDRFVVLGYQGTSVVIEELLNQIPSPLIVGPDPSLPESEQISVDGGELEVNEDLRWMVDFDTAIDKGLGAKIPLTSQQAANGFDRLFVLGVRLSADESEGQTLVEDLIAHHQNSRQGFELLPQGVNTNNTETEAADYRYVDDPDESFDDLKQSPLYTPESDWFKKKDGQWFAEMLGLKHSAVNTLHNADHTDQCEAKAMNVALWPSTMGYMMESMMDPVFDPKAIKFTREFFTHCVSGRGMIPAVKIGDQPYGILPTTAFSKIKWFRNVNQESSVFNPTGFYDSDPSFLAKNLYDVLTKVDQDWAAFANDVPHVNKTGDPHQILLDILGLNPSSVEFYQRYAQSWDDIYNRAMLYGIWNFIVTLFTAGAYVSSGINLLAGFGVSLTDTPEILEKFFINSQNLLKGSLIDDVPLSELTPVRDYTADGRNYIKWLRDAAGDSHNTLRKKQGFIDNKVPSSLLFLMLHHALDLSYVETSVKLFAQASLISPAQVQASKVEPSFLHVKSGSGVSGTESRWNYLYRSEPLITSSSSMMVGDYIPTQLTTTLATEYLNDQLKALDHLEEVPTSRLERVFAEHIDTCTYRLDAWKTGLIQYGLTSARYAGQLPATGYNEGLYVGAFGWLENVKSENKVLTSVNLNSELQQVFNPENNLDIVADSTNGGHLLAPSLNHAVTAAILRNGYLANASDPSNADTLSINLSSERVRKAIAIIEGIRGGQSLSALLGYQFERGLHDHHPGVELDYYIYHIRKEFPLNTNIVNLTGADNLTAATPMESIEARNVVDGLALLNHIKSSGLTTYPWGKASLPTVTDPSESTAINTEIDRIQDMNDAIADVAMAESVHQVAQGNYDRGSATLDTYTKGNFPPIPDVIQTPRSGINITHRFGLQLEAGADHTASPNSLAMTPRATGEPAINKWLNAILPAAADIACISTYYNRSTSTQVSVEVTVDDLKLQPADLLYILDTNSDKAMTALDDRVEKFMRDTYSPRPDDEFTIEYTTAISGKVNFFELAALTSSLRAIVLRSRPLLPNDVSRPTDAKTENDSPVTFNSARLTSVKSGFATALTSVNTYVTSIQALTVDTVANRASLISGIDALANDLANIFDGASNYGLQQAAIGFVYDTQKQLFESLIAQVDDLITSWTSKLADYDSLIADYDALPGSATTEERFALLQKAERQISTQATIPLPALPLTMRTALNTTRGNFESKLNSFSSISDTSTTTVSGLHASIAAELPVTNFVRKDLDITEQEDQIILFAQTLDNRAVLLQSDMNTRNTKAQTSLNDASTATEPAKAVEHLKDAAKYLLGEDFKIVPEFAMTTDQADEWDNSLNAANDLLNYASTTLQIDFPMDDWLYGIARVKEKMHHWENVTLLTEAFGGSEPSLRPIQFPHIANDTWLGLEYPETYSIDSDRLLYTAHYGYAFDKTKQQCGLLIEEWTETIPSKEETVGTTFHFDVPNSEPAQTMLLAVSPSFDGAWTWQNLLDTLNETLDMAKKRGIEPDQVDTSAYARFLPAVVSSVTVHPITSALNFAFNNEVYDKLN